MKKINLREAVEALHQEAIKHDSRTPPFDQLWKKLEQYISIGVLTKEAYRNAVDSGYEGYCEEEDIGSFTWFDGECAVSEEYVRRLSSLVKEGLQRGESMGEVYVMLFTVLAVLETRNAILCKMQEQVQRVGQIRQNLIENLKRSQGTERKYQELSLEIVEKCQALCRELIESYSVNKT